MEFESFDAEEEVISVILEDSHGTVQLDVIEGTGGVEILANGKPMAKVAAIGQPFKASNIRVLQSRCNL